LNNFEGQKVLVLCDFDGTVCTVDMGNKILNHFTDEGWDEIDRAYSGGEMGSLEAYRKVSSLLKVSKSEAERFIHAYARIDPGFSGFREFCQENGMDMKIVSDGLDFYIRAVLEKHGLEDMEFFSNALVFREDGTLFIDFPSVNGDCNWCGTCKSQVLQRHRKFYDQIIYIGDGYSDVCPSKNADVVFAKDILYSTCLKNGVPCIYYGNFGDIQKYFNEKNLHEQRRG
jgi:2,3-diketo-5-methylthio-1-phosphopentane phosphatase